MMITQFPPHLASPGSDLHEQYQQYLAIEAASAQMARLHKSGAWPYAANKENVIKLCLSSSTFYDYWNKPFSQINSVPRIKKWLLCAPDAESDANIWDQCEQNLTQLALWITAELTQLEL